MTTWLVNQRRAGEETPHVSIDVVRLARERASLPLTMRIDRFFELVGKKTDRLGQSIDLRVSASRPTNPSRDEFCAWTECIDEQELATLCNILVEEKLLINNYETLLTARGYQRLEATQTKLVPSTRAFVAMWFDPSMAAAYEQGIKPAIETNGYEPVHLGQKEHINDINDEIIMEIRRARFLVADFTCPIVSSTTEDHPISRGGVYWEAGFAAGLNIPVVWCCRSDCLKHLHFDIRQYAHIDWAEPSELRRRLSNCIAAAIVQGSAGTN